MYANSTCICIYYILIYVRYISIYYIYEYTCVGPIYLYMYRPTYIDYVCMYLYIEIERQIDETILYTLQAFSLQTWLNKIYCRPALNLRVTQPLIIIIMINIA